MYKIINYIDYLIENTIAAVKLNEFKKYNRGLYNLLKTL